VGTVTEIVVATNNRHKFEEISAILKGVPVRLITLSDYPDAPELKEEGETYADNAVHKARTIARFTGKWALGDDTGLEVDALNGQPGLFSARFAGEGVTFADNRRKLLRLMESVPTEKRTATFRTVLALVSPSGVTHVAEGVLRGRIADRERGTAGFGYDAVFDLPELGKTYAELSSEEKNRISHRARAVQKIREHLEKIVGV
jgi:XTP/dITP diphosphohydrolase